MDAKNYFPHGKPKLTPPDEFFRAYELLREADYRDFWLRDTALATLEQYSKDQKPNKDKSQVDELYYLWCLCLQAEIRDYYEDYAKARQILEDEGKALKKQLRDNELGMPPLVAQQGNGARDLIESPGALPSQDAQKPLLRQQLWILILYAHCEYRSHKWDEARALLLEIRRQVDRHFPLDETNPDEPSYGLRARIAYSLGQVGRRLSDLGARSEFVSAILLHAKAPFSQDAQVCQTA
jgi:hypothetical protein